jgi:hypothetical protein
MITIGAIIGGLELTDSQIDRRITAIALAAEDLTKKFVFGSSPAINVVLHVRGSLFKPEFKGLRNAKFSRKEQMLMVQVAVPSKICKSTDPIDQYLIDSLHQANAIAWKYFEKKGFDYPYENGEKLIRKIDSKIKSAKYANIKASPEELEDLKHTKEILRKFKRQKRQASKPRG